jgi:hypothetical protein
LKWVVATGIGDTVGSMAGFVQPQGLIMYWFNPQYSAIEVLQRQGILVLLVS